MKKVVKRRKDGVVQSYWKGDIEKLTTKNNNFRKVIYTGKDEQLVLMTIPVGGEIGNEVHPHLDQFFRIEEGRAKFIINNSKTFTIAAPGGAAVVHAGTYHNVKNVGKKPLKLYALYSRPNHPKGQIDKTRMDAILREAKAEHKPLYEVEYFPHHSNRLKIVRGFLSRKEAMDWIRAENLQDADGLRIDKVIK